MCATDARQQRRRGSLGGRCDPATTVGDHKRVISGTCSTTMWGGGVQPPAQANAGHDCTRVVKGPNRQCRSKRGRVGRVTRENGATGVGKRQSAPPSNHPVRAAATGSARATAQLPVRTCPHLHLQRACSAGGALEVAVVWGSEGREPCVTRHSAHHTTHFVGRHHQPAHFGLKRKKMGWGTINLGPFRPNKFPELRDGTGRSLID